MNRTRTESLSKIRTDDGWKKKVWFWLGERKKKIEKRESKKRKKSQQKDLPSEKKDFTGSKSQPMRINPRFFSFPTAKFSKD